MTMFQRCALLMLTICLCSLVCFVSCQFESNPMSFQPMPYILQLPNGGQQNPANFRYSVINNGNGEEDRSLGSVIEMNSFNPNQRRNDVSSMEVPSNMRYSEERPRSGQKDRYDSYYSRQPGRASRGWQTMRNSEQRPRRPSRQSRKDTLSVHPSIFRGERMTPVVAEVKRNPRIVKYIADENGFAVREDLYQPLQDSMTRSRTKQRILTSGSSPLMSQVVTSAIRVANGQSNSGGKYLPQIVDLKVGK